MSTKWKNFSEMGSKKLMLIMRWIILHTNRHLARACLYLIVGYYFFLTKKGKTDSKKFLDKVLPKPASPINISKHFFYWASTLLDRVYMVSGKTHLLSLEVINAELVTTKLSVNNGCIMLGSHLGSFEILRCLAQIMGNLPLKIVIDVGSSQQFNKNLYAINPEIEKLFIHATDQESVFAINNALKQGSMIGILGDRVINKQRKITCDFLGEKADLPTGPMLLASLFEVPVILFFGIYLGGNRYRVIFELFSERILVDRNQREQQIGVYVESYVKRLEHYAKQYPYNWFNFYDYWKHN